ncbi:hypothetical protein ZWY2020_053944 [Hordeum vulgare]|nr:hypothetical protein ZWY2020_053944 [Hordeum vulgare]
MASAGSNHRQRAEQAPAAGLDELMSLPPEMLNNILARLPFKELVRTSRLSRAWRRRWESVHGLDIRLDPESAAAPGARAMWRCSAPVAGLTARVRARHFHRAARWLLALARKRVEKLVLRFDNPWDFESSPVVGPALFSCAALADLQLYGYCHMMRAPPGFQGFPNLVTLVLDNLLLPFSGAAAQLQRIISSAPGLTELSLYDVIAGGPGADFEICAIRAPCLRVLKLFIFLDNGCRLAEDLPLLEEASISIDVLFGTPAFLDTFRRISNVKKLSFRTDSELVKVNPLKKISWKFQNLRVAHLTAIFGSLPSIWSIFSLLRFGPHVEELHIQADKPFAVFEGLFPAALGAVDLDDNIDQDVLDAKISDDLFANLKHISLEDMNCLPNDMWFMKVLLSKAGLLQSFVVTLDYGGETESYEEACAELEAFERASPQAQLELRLAEMPDYLEDF